MIRQGRGKEPADLCLFPKGDKYGHLDSIIRSSRIVWGAYAIRPYRQGWRLVFLSPFLSLMKEKEAKENQGVRDASQIYRIPAGDVRDAGQIYRVRAGAVRDASQIYRVRDVGRTYVPARWMGFDRAAYVLRPLTVLCDPLYKCEGRLWVLAGWGRGVMGRVWGLNGLHIIY